MSDHASAVMHHVRRGVGKPLVLVHGLGSSWRSWSPILDALAAERTVVAVDLPGFGETPPLPGEVSIATLADAMTAFLDEQGLRGADVVGSSMGARLVLELARRDVVGAVVSLDPGGFWRGWETTFFATTIGASVSLVRAIQPLVPVLTRTAIGRTLLFLQFSARPWALSPELTRTELRTFARAPSFDPLLHSLVHGPRQQGMPAERARPIVIGWGRQDRVCPPRQARRALATFPGARLHWFEDCGHFPMWDQPDETVRLILDTTR